MAREMSRTALIFARPGEVVVQNEAASEPGPGEVSVRTLASLISSGTELLAYRGHLPDGLPLDSAIAAMSKPMEYPLRYGYSIVGVVDRVGPETERAFLDQRVFAFQPHASRFTAPVEALIPLPDGLESEDAVFLANMETALTLAHDAGPLLGDRVLIVGQGMVGLLTAALISRAGVEAVITCDPVRERRERSLAWGASHSVSPGELAGLLADDPVDIAIELSGSSVGLQAAIDFTGFAGRIVVGSWYGDKPVQLDLGSRFHRARQEIIASQVSTVNPALSARWPKERRISTALDLLKQLSPSQLITHRIPLRDAQRAYDLLSSSPEEVLGILFEYEDGSSGT